MSDRRSITSPQNAHNSTGPKTPAGKAAASRNAMKFGVYSEVTVTADESESEFLAFAKRMRADLAPVGELELTLVDRIISTAWRLRRFARLEALIYDDEDRPENLFTGYTAERVVRLGRHEATLERSLMRCLHELRQLQAERKRDTTGGVVNITPTDQPGRSELGSFRQNEEIPNAKVA